MKRAEGVFTWFLLAAMIVPVILWLAGRTLPRTLDVVIGLLLLAGSAAFSVRRFLAR
jgi:membrane protein implicated in regulation of membrane protease activity